MSPHSYSPRGVRCNATVEDSLACWEFQPPPPRATGIHLSGASPCRSLPSRCRRLLCTSPVRARVIPGGWGTTHVAAHADEAAHHRARSTQMPAAMVADSRTARGLRTAWSR